MDSLSIGIVSFGYPPIAHVSGTRAYYMAKELAARGHRVTVMTVDWRDPPGAEVTKEEGVVVVRIDPRAWNREFTPNGPPFRVDRDIAFTPLRRLRTLRRVARWGAHEPWARAAMTRMLARHAAAPLDVVWSIHGDDSAHEIAFRYHRATGVPWVADFKDAWHSFHRYRLPQHLAVSRRLRTASALTETAEVQANEDREEFGKPTHVIWSGYDAALMADATPSRSSPGFCLVQTGHLSPHHDIEALGRLLRRWRDREPARPIELHIYGHRSDLLFPVLERNGVTDLLQRHDFVPRRAAFGLMKGADVLLLLPSKEYLPSVGVKELEYFASGTPVVCLGGLLPEMRRVADALPQAILAETEDAAVDALRDEYVARREHGRPRRAGDVNAAPVARHAWRQKADDLAAVLADVVAHHRARAPHRTVVSRIAHALWSARRSP